MGDPYIYTDDYFNSPYFYKCSDQGHINMEVMSSDVMYNSYYLVS